MQLSELKGVCKQRGIPTSGAKGEIVERILAAPAAKIFGMELDSLSFLKKPAAHDGFEVFAFSGFPVSADAFEIFSLIKQYVSDYLGEFALEVCGTA